MKLLRHYVEQTRRAEILMAEYALYAESIGCKLGQGALSGEVECDEAQSALLAKWWREHVDEQQ